MGGCHSDNEEYSPPLNPIIPQLIKKNGREGEGEREEMKMVVVSFDCYSWHIYMIPKNKKMLITKFYDIIRKERRWSKDVWLQFYLGTREMRLYKKDSLDENEWVKYFLDEYFISETDSILSCKITSKSPNIPTFPKTGTIAPSPLEMIYVKNFNRWLDVNGYKPVDPNQVIRLLYQYEYYEKFTGNKKQMITQLDQLKSSLKLSSAIDVPINFNLDR